MKENEKSIVENTLLQIKAVEDAISENAKGILASTMKEEISELVKESLNGSKKSKRSLREQEEEVTTDVVDTEEEGDEEGMEDDAEVYDDSEIEGDDEDMTGMEDDAETEVDNELPPLDMTNASPDEVLKVFRAMGDQDGIIVKKDGPYVHLSDSDTDKDYLIRVEENRKRKMKSKINEEVLYELSFDDKKSKFQNLDDVDFEEEDDDETLYELHMDEEDTDDDLESEMYETYKFKSKGPKFKYPSKMKKGVSETAFDDSDDDTSWEDEDEMMSSDEMYEEDEMMSSDEMYEEDEMMSSDEMYEEDVMVDDKDGDKLPDEMYESYKFKSKGPKFKYPSKMKKGVTETSYDDSESDELGEEWNEEDETMEKPGEKSEAARTLGNGKYWGRKGLPKQRSAPRHIRVESVNSEVKVLREKNEEYKKALDFFRNKLNEVAVFNSNLAYSTRLFTEHSTTKQEKINILRRFDDIETLKESKNLYKTIKNELDGKGSNNLVKESITEKVVRTPQTGSATNLIESKTYENPQFLRMKDLMTKIG